MINETAPTLAPSDSHSGLAGSILNPPTEAFRPQEPVSLAETGLSEALVDSLIAKYLLGIHRCTGRQLANVLGLPFSIIDKRITALKTRRLIDNTDVNSFGDFTLQLTEEGHRQAQRWFESCSYVGVAPVPLEQYTASVKAQLIKQESVERGEIEKSFGEISIRSNLMARIGPAIRSGCGLFLHGAPGNGKTTIAERIGNCYAQSIWIPHALVVEGAIIRVFDPAYHRPVDSETASGILRGQTHDERWVRISRPTVVAGGELTLESLEIRHDTITNISEAPLQLKANGGVLVIDDFGRQRISPADLLNRWIVPLDRKFDLLTLFTGKRIEVPFELLVVFSTNLDPGDLVDEAFLRRIPYKIHVTDPRADEFKEIFRSAARKVGVRYEDSAIETLLDRHYLQAGRPMRRCHPRDLLLHLVNHCDYLGVASELKEEILDKVAADYFLSGPSISVDADH